MTVGSESLGAFISDFVSICFGMTLLTHYMLLGPSYITSRSADVILSDVRPIKLKIDALQSINVLLDELLYTILATSRSLSINKLKAALSKLIPTNLGKEALLEAELELKAYHERTTPPPSSPTQESEGEFDLQWSFEVSTGCLSRI